MTIIATEDGSLGVACGENHEVLATEWELRLLDVVDIEGWVKNCYLKICIFINENVILPHIFSQLFYKYTYLFKTKQWKAKNFYCRRVTFHAHGIM